MKGMNRKEGLGHLFLTVAGITLVLMGLLLSPLAAVGKESSGDYVKRGTDYLKRGQYDQAIADANKALESDPSVYLLKATACEKINRKKEAIEAYREFVKHASPQDKASIEDAKQRIAALEKTGPGQDKGSTSGSSTAVEYDYYMKRGIDDFFKGQYEQAIADLTKVIELDRRSIEAYYYRGAAYAKRGQHDEGIADLTKAIDLNPKLASSFSYRGMAYLAKGQYDQATADANKAIELDYKFAQAYFVKARACEKMKRTKEAIEAYRAFIKYASSPPDKSQAEKVREKITELEKQQ